MDFLKKIFCCFQVFQDPNANGQTNLRGHSERNADLTVALGEHAGVLSGGCALAKSLSGAGAILAVPAPPNQRALQDWRSTRPTGLSWEGVKALKSALLSSAALLQPTSLQLLKLRLFVNARLPDWTSACSPIAPLKSAFSASLLQNVRDFEGRILRSGEEEAKIKAASQMDKLKFCRFKRKYSEITLVCSFFWNLSVFSDMNNLIGEVSCRICQKSFSSTIRAMHDHKNMVLCIKLNQDGSWVLTASKDQIIKGMKLRMLMRKIEGDITQN
ncbi:Flowering time control protein FY [Morella rubra]|uniref:Flowering time control protein FY n=1 Tax=Morella rubra TaxID=262757 RepID=A0A6A1URM8_9ROSI|nr:Flowering time control protein FY [Morella rubra]